MLLAYSCNSVGKIEIEAGQTSSSLVHGSNRAWYVSLVCPHDSLLWLTSRHPVKLQIYYLPFLAVQCAKERLLRPVDW